MTAYVLVLLAISLVLLPFGRGQLRSNRLALACLGAIALCYVMLISLAFDVESTVVRGDENTAQRATPWFGNHWLEVALFTVPIIALLHIVLWLAVRRSKHSDSEADQPIAHESAQRVR